VTNGIAGATEEVVQVTEERAEATDRIAGATEEVVQATD